MRLFYLLVLVLFLMDLSAQNSHSIGFQFSQKQESMENMSLRYEYMISKNNGIKSQLGWSLFHDFRSYHFKLGYQRQLVQYKKLSIWSGLDYEYEHLDFAILDQDNDRKVTFSIPLEINWRLNDKIDLFSGISVPVNIHSAKGYNYSEYNTMDFRIGITKRL